MTENDNIVGYMILTAAIIIILSTTIVAPYLNSYYYHANEIGAITSIKPESNSFTIDNSYDYSCPTINVTSLHINEVIHYTQTHDYMFPNALYKSNIMPFHIICNITVIQP